MGDNFYSKDYGDYFAQLEKEVEIKNKIEEENKQNKNLSAKDYKMDRRRKMVLRAKIVRASVVLVALVLALTLVISIFSSDDTTQQKVEKKISVKKEEKPSIYAKYTSKTDNMTKLPNVADESADYKGIKSESGIFINLKTNEVIAAKNANRRAFPASTTKIMTLLVAVENITDYSQTFKMTYLITNPLHAQGATVAGYISGEVLTVDDLLYGTILPSGGDAAIGLAEMISGSEEEFVKLMNKKAKDLGLKNTNFKNCTGLYHEEHYTTAEDLAVILKEAIKNEKCREVLSTYEYTSSKTRQHPNGILMQSTLFRHVKGDEPDGADIIGGKTGYVGQSGYCIATFGKTEDGTEYICATLNAESKWPAFYDHINIFSHYT